MRRVLPTVAAGADWVVVLPSGEAPVTVHMPSGEARRHVDAPLPRYAAPNAVWTGDRLVVWGGQALADADAGAAVTGAVWTP